MGGTAVRFSISPIVDGKIVGSIGEATVQHGEVLGVLHSDLRGRHLADGERQQAKERKHPGDGTPHPTGAGHDVEPRKG